MYTPARSSALAVAAIVAVFVRSDPYLEAIASTMVIVQAVGSVIGALTHERLKTLGPAASLANAAALIWLLRH
jgi:hypothetical protein